MASEGTPGKRTRSDNADPGAGIHPAALSVNAVSFLLGVPRGCCAAVRYPPSHQGELLVGLREAVLNGWGCDITLELDDGVAVMFPR